MKNKCCLSVKRKQLFDKVVDFIFITFTPDQLISKNKIT